MSRLIDADDFKKFLNKLIELGAPYEDVVKLLDNQPTAFDVDKVVEQLEVLKNLNHKEWKKSSWTGEEIMPYLFAHNSYVKAIKIVKAGGIDE